MGMTIGEQTEILFPTTTKAIAIVKYNDCICALEEAKEKFMAHNITLKDLRILRQFFKNGTFQISGDYKLFELINSIYLCSRDAGIISDDVEIISSSIDDTTITKFNEKYYIESNGNTVPQRHYDIIEEYKVRHQNILKPRLK